MKQVTNVRNWLTSRLGQAFKVQLSMLNEVECVDLMKGPDGQLMVARWVDQIMRDLGHESQTPVEDPNSRVRRSAQRRV